jgi:molybdopterin-guanine dinucleotide biosynthesis protein
MALQDEDKVIVEGFKNNKYPKIEIHRKEAEGIA